MLRAGGEPVSLDCQRGGLEAIRAGAEQLVQTAQATVAAVITSGPDRPEPLSQFLAAGRAGLVTGHRLPNLATVEGPSAGRAALALLAQGLSADEAVARVLRSNPDIDAGLIAVTPTDLGLANSAHVEGRDDLGRALIMAEDRRYGFGLLHNSIAPAEGLAQAVAAVGEAVLARAGDS